MSKNLAFPGACLALCSVFWGAALGCGGSKARTVSTAPGTGGQTKPALGDGGTAPKSSKDAGALTKSDAGTQDPAAPMVKVIAPTAASDLNSDPIVTDPMPNVQCRVQRSVRSGAQNLNAGSVRIFAISMNDPKTRAMGTVNAMPDNVFSAQVDVSGMQNGLITFRCEADDVSMPVKTGWDQIDTFLDLGPNITISEPVKDSSHQLQTPVLIKFTVDPAPVSDADMQAMPKSVTLDVSGTSFDFMEDPSQPGAYSTNVDFDDRSLFPMPPSSAEITVTASDNRMTNAPTRKAVVDFKLDADGPTIKVTDPPDGKIVGGNVTLTVTITDPSGVDPASVRGTINKDLFILENWKVHGDTYTVDFDTRSFGTELTQLTINIEAQDKVGNKSTVSITLKLDNLPPLVSLDPPMIREWKMDGDVIRCSAAFDPVGDLAVNDLATVSTMSSVYRVLVEDETNHSTGALLDYVASVDPATVAMYVQPDTTIPLLIDTNGDGKCDEINSGDGANGVSSGMLPKEQQPVKLSLAPVNPNGNPYYDAGDKFDAPAIPAGFGCVAGADTSPPKPLCSATEMFRVVGQRIMGNPPAVYAFDPTNASGSTAGACNGNSWEVPPAGGPSGWRCLAARALDTIKNVGISRPLRVCFTNGSGTCSAPAPSCTDGCSLPPDFEANAVWHQQ